MKFCFITTFFGEHSFGGDSVFVERLTRELLNAGHEVHVIYNRDAFDLLKGDRSPRDVTLPHNLTVYPLRSALGRFSPILQHQTGGPGDLASSLRTLLKREAYDVIHVYNISLIGGPGLLQLMANTAPTALRIMTAIEYWLTCPLSVRWKFDRETCENPTCIACTLRAGRPPQWWRYLGMIKRDIATLDALIFPSQYAHDFHVEQGIEAANMRVLTGFLPDAWFEDDLVADTPPDRPYFIVAGRLVKEKGFQHVIDAMDATPEADLFIAGDGPYKTNLHALARGRSNVRFLGVVNLATLRNYYRNASATVVPSLMVETFGNAWLESLATGTPVIASDVGPLPEFVEETSGGRVFRGVTGLRILLRSVIDEPSTWRALGRAGQQYVRQRYTSKRHMSDYLSLVCDLSECDGVQLR